MKIENGYIFRFIYYINCIKCFFEWLNFKFDEYVWWNELNDVIIKYYSG